MLRKNKSYITTVLGFWFKYHITMLGGWLVLVSRFLAIFPEFIERSIEHFTVVCRSIIDEPSAPVSIQVLTDFLAYLNALNMSDFLSKEYIDKRSSIFGTFQQYFILLMMKFILY